MTPVTTLWHPDSPGMRVPVRRGWLGRLLKPKEFATIGEVLAYYRAVELADAGLSVGLTSGVKEDQRG